MRGNFANFLVDSTMSFINLDQLPSVLLDLP